MLTGRTLGDFAVKEKIGEGGYGVVYRAEQRLLGREAVIKVLHARHQASEALIQRFLREAQLASRLDHPYAAHIYAFGAEPDGLLWIAMEFVRGTPLSRVLATQPGARMPLARFVPLLDRLCEVVHTAHEQGIVHRDLKPDNVMVLSRAGRLLPKLLDLGIAKLVADTSPEPVAAVDSDALAATLVPTSGGALTQRGARIGSPYYMAPEQWLDATEVDLRTDLYALGVLTYEALAGRVPFGGTTIGEIARGHQRGDVPPLPADVPAALAPVIARALAKDKEARFPSALAFAEAMRAAAGMRLAADALPRLDESLRADVAWMPQPIADAIAVLEAARNPHQARDAVAQIVHVAARYLGILALAARSRIGPGASADSPAVLDLVRELPRRELTDLEWIELVRALTAPFASARDAYPIPELVDLAARDVFAPLLAQRASDLATTSEESLRDRLARTLPLLTPLLRALTFLADYPLVVPASDGAEAWMGPRRPRRSRIAISADADGPLLVDIDGRPVLQLAPLVQAASPAPGADLELFFFAGPGRARGRGARLVAEPHGFERHDEAVWDWLRTLLPLDSADAAPIEETPYRGLAAFTAADSALFFGRERQVESFINQLLIRPLLAVVGPSGAGKSSFVQAGVLPALAPGWTSHVLRPGATPLAALSRIPRRAADETQVVVVDQLEELFTLCLDPSERLAFATALADLTADDRVRVVLTVRDDFLARAGDLPPLRDRLAQGLTLLSTPAPDDLLRILVEPARRAGYDFDDKDLPARMVRAVAGQPGALALLSFTAARLWDLRDRHFRRLTRTAYDAIGGVEGALAVHAEDVLSSCSPEEQRLVREAFRHLVTAEGTRAVLTRADLSSALGSSPRAAAAIERLISARLLVATEGESGEQIEVVHEALLSAWPRLVDWRREDAEGARLRDQLRAAARQWADRGRPRGLLWRSDALDDYRRWRTRWPGSLPALDLAFATASLKDARRGLLIRRTLAITAFTVLTAAVLGLLLLYRSSQDNAATARANAATAKQRLIESYVEQGRRLLLDGDYLRALPYLSEAYSQGAHDTATRFLLARALRWAKAEVATFRHDAPVRAAVFREDDATILSVAIDGSAVMSKADTGELIAEIPGARRADDAPIYPRVSDDGAIAVLPRVEDVIVWDGKTARTIPGRADRVAVDVAGERIVTSHGNTLNVWDADSLEPISRVAGVDAGGGILAGDEYVVVTDAMGAVHLVDASGARALGVHPNATVAGRDHFATIADNVVTVWSATGRRLQTITMSATGLAGALSPRGNLIAIGGQDGAIRVFDTTTGKPHGELVGHRGVPELVFSRDGSKLASCGRDERLVLWDVADGERIATITIPPEECQSIRFDTGGTRVVLGFFDRSVRIFRLRNPDVVMEIDAGRPLGTSSMSADGRTIVATSTNGVEVWSHDGAVKRHFDVAAYDLASVSPDGNIVAIPIDGENKVELRSVSTGAVMATLQTTAAPTSAAFDGRGTRVVTTAKDGVVDVWEPSGERLAQLRGHSNEATFASFNPDASRVVSASTDGTVRLWEVAGGTEVRRLDVGNTVNSAMFDASGRRILVAAADRLVRLVDTSTFAVVATFEHESPVAFAAISPDGRFVAAATFDGTVEVWSVSPETLVAVYRHQKAAAAATFDPTGRRVVSSARDGRLVLWNVEAAVTDDQPSGGCHARFRLVGTRLERMAVGDCAESSLRSTNEATATP